jgi:EPS-associated MarR family transcriptional regulator
MNINPVKEEIHLRLMRIIIEAENKITQRDLARRAGISLGRVNQWIAEMIAEGLIKIERLKKEGSKTVHTYLLTQKGMEEKFRLLIHTLSHKIREHELLEKEIEALNREIRQHSVTR